MDLITNKQKLFTLFSACLPADETVQRELLIESIISMPEYSSTMATPSWKYLSKVYSIDALKKYNMATLKRIPSAIKAVPNTLLYLESCIQSGDAWRLTASDMPDWTSAISITKFREKLHYSQDEPNVTNLTQEKILLVFLDSVVRSPLEVLNNWTVQDCQNIELGVQKALNGKLYCIPRAEFERQNVLIAESDTLITEIQNYKKEVKYVTLTKKACTFLAGMLLSLFAPIALNMPSEGVGLFYLLAFIISIVYAVKG
jgi:hypothetical protein